MNLDKWIEKTQPINDAAGQAVRFLTAPLRGVAGAFGEIGLAASKPMDDYRRNMRQAMVSEAFSNIDNMFQQNGPLNEWTMPQQIRLAQAIKKTGLDFNNFASANEQLSRTNSFNALMANQDVANNAYLASNIINKNSVAPVKVVGGVAYNQYTPNENAILAVTDAVNQEGLIKSSQAEIEKIRLDAVKKLFGADENQLTDTGVSNAGIHPLLALDIVNNKTLYNSKDTNMVNENGDLIQVRQVLQPDGTWKYSPVLPADNNSESLSVPPSGSYAEEVRFIQQSLNISEAEAIAFKESVPAQTDEQLFISIMGYFMNSLNTDYGKNADEVINETVQVFKFLRPDSPLAQLDFNSTTLDAYRSLMGNGASGLNLPSLKTGLMYKNSVPVSVTLREPMVSESLQADDNISRLMNIINQTSPSPSLPQVRPPLLPITQPTQKTLITPPDVVLTQAREAIAKGASIDAVLQRLEEMGFSGEGLR